MKNMLKGKNLLLLALVGGGAYWYWMKMKKDKAAKMSKAVGSTNFTGDLDLVAYQNLIGGKVPKNPTFRYGSQFNRATDVSGVEYYVPNVKVR
jgi:uncharacterized membrane protein